MSNRVATPTPLDYLMESLKFDSNSVSCFHRIVSLWTGRIREWILLSSGNCPMLASLSESAIYRLARSPAVCMNLRTEKGRPLTDLVGAECDFSLGQHNSRWTALGDAWLGSFPPNSLQDILSLREGYWNSATLTNGIPIDLSVGMSTIFPKARFRSSSSLEDDTASDLCKVNEAISLLLQQPQPFAEFVRVMTSNVILYTEQQHSRLRSSTNAAAIGRVLIVNASQHNVFDIAEALVHEAVHTAVSCCELYTPLLRNKYILRNVTSPWTGATLPMHAFAHAIFVWSALIRLRHACGKSADDINSGFFRLKNDQGLMSTLFRALDEPARDAIDNIIETSV